MVNMGADKRSFYKTNKVIAIVVTCFICPMLIQGFVWRPKPTGYCAIGTCVLTEECPSIKEVISLYGSDGMPKELKEKIQNDHCGFEGHNTKTCCPDEIQKPPNPSVSTRNLNKLPNDCGIMSVGDRINNGEDAALFEFPWMALLRYKTKAGPKPGCGGSLITKRYVLTAAHCVKTKEKLKDVLLGEYNLKTQYDCDESNKRCVVAYNIPIESYKTYNDDDIIDDIALIRLGVDISFNYTVRPICLPINEATRNFNKKRVVAAGWGFVIRTKRPTVLQKTTLTVRTRAECLSMFGNENIILKDTEMCIGGNGSTETCQGDSGGPIMQMENIHNDARTFQLGVISRGSAYCGQNKLDIYVKVADYMDWILENI